MVVSYQYSHAQDTIGLKNSAYVEFFGNTGGTLLSLNYERLISLRSKKLNNKLACRVGLGYAQGSSDSSKSTPYFDLRVPVETSLIIGKKRHFFEFGIGFTPILILQDNEKSDHSGDIIGFYTLRLGYRYMTEGFLLRFAPVLYIGKTSLDKSRSMLELSAGASAGILFNFKRHPSI